MFEAEQKAELSNGQAEMYIQEHMHMHTPHTCTKTTKGCHLKSGHMCSHTDTCTHKSKTLQCIIQQFPSQVKYFCQQPLVLHGVTVSAMQSKHGVCQNQGCTRVARPNSASTAQTPCVHQTFDSASSFDTCSKILLLLSNFHNPHIVDMSQTGGLSLFYFSQETGSLGSKPHQQSILLHSNIHSENKKEF